jgi:hypothetical protein
MEKFHQSVDLFRVCLVPKLGLGMLAHQATKKLSGGQSVANPTLILLLLKVQH